MWSALLALTETAPGAKPEHAAQGLAHRAQVGSEGRGLGNDRGIDVRDREPPVAEEVRDVLEEDPARGPREARVGAWKVLAHVARRGRAEQGIAHGMDQAVAVRMTLESPVEGNEHAAEHEAPAGHQPVGIEAGADPVAQAPAPTRGPARRCSAQARSSGVVILRLRAEPGTTATTAPIRSTASASSVKVTRSRKACW